jgi:hypothetical protein
LSPEYPENPSTAVPKTDSGLDPDEILGVEFNYIAQAAFQANEDRARVTSYYLVSVGSFIAAILGTQLFSNPNSGVYLAFAALFFFLATLAVLTILQLVRLRLAWYEAARAMDQIKDYYIRNTRHKGLGQALRWQTATLPRPGKRSSISFYLAVEVAIIGAASFAAAVYFSVLGLGWSSWPVAVILGVVFFVIEQVVYQRRLIVK